MDQHKLRIGVSLSLVVAFSVATSSMASDRMQCHDLPAKQAILDEGNELLRQQPSPLRTPVDVHGLGHIPRFLIEDYPNPYFDPRFDYSNEPDADAHNKLPVETLVQLRSAINTAEVLERYFRANSANILLTRIISSPRFSKLTPTEQAAVFESAARTKIEWGLKKETESPNSFRDRIFSTDHLYFGSMAFMTPLRLRHFTLDATRRTSLSPEDFTLVKDNYLRALALRSKSKSSEELSTDLLILGALSEQTNELSNAAKYFSQAMSMIENAAKAKSITANAEASSQSEEQKYLTDDARVMIVSTQIRANLVSGKTYDPSQAVKLFEDNCLNKPRDPVIISVQSLLSVLDVLPSTDVPALSDYVLRLVVDKNQSVIMATNFTTILQKMKARGWGTECKTLSDLATNQFNTDSLLMVARWYAASKDDAHLVNTAKMILHAIQNDSDEQALASLTLLATLLPQASTSEPELSTVRSETARITAYHEDQIRRKQCMHMADSLNQTALRLELKAQPEMASKLYKEALEIKQMNLRADDPDTAAQLVDLARSEAEQHKFAESQVHYEKALTILRKNSKADPADTISALESYGMMLNDWNHGAKATEIYDEAKALHNKMSQPKKLFAR